MEKEWFISKDGEITVYDSIEKFPESCVGFVYKITNKKTGMFYIGKKSLYSTVSKKLTKKELAEYAKPGKKPTKKRVTTESSWRTYWGSSDVLLAEIKENGTDQYEKEILKLCNNRKALTYWEVHHQCINEVLISSKSFNSNVLSKFFRRDLLE